MELPDNTSNIFKKTVITQEQFRRYICQLKARNSVSNTVSGYSVSGNVLNPTTTPDSVLENVLITLRDDQNNVVGTSTTDNKGHYFFTDLSEGTYTLETPSGVYTFEENNLTTLSFSFSGGIDIFKFIYLSGE